ncbi:hypothetical protein [Nonomuraea wenchangensis]|uniref:hypothetical protein n=1 Tax=Nonomuraea wenchangensis TaxID=568860 RepID=UPI000B873B3C|nr:hypothetical protein [Nonomuraea wenchangensis]
MEEVCGVLLLGDELLADRVQAPQAGAQRVLPGVEVAVEQGGGLARVLLRPAVRPLQRGDDLGRFLGRLPREARGG